MTQAWRNGGVSKGDAGGAIALDPGALDPVALDPIALDPANEPLELPWIGLRLLAGEKPEAVAALLVEHGVEKREAVRRVAEATKDPLVAAGLARARRAEKVACLFEAFAKQLRQSPVAEGVPVEDRISPARFYENYYYANRPVVVRGLMEDWPALRRWSPAHFAERFGDEMLEVTAEREADPRFEDNFSNHRRRMTMNQLVDAVTQGRGNDVYLVAKNRLLEHEPFTSLLEDLSYPAGLLTTGSDAVPPRMWFGGAQTVTPLHHDASNIFFGQIYGRKLVRLIPPYEIENIYNDRTCFSDIDLDDVDYVRFPRFRQVTVLQAVVDPGDFLLFPIGWWHQVRALDISISLSFQNFAVPGGPVVWYYPPT